MYKVFERIIYNTMNIFTWGKCVQNDEENTMIPTGKLMNSQFREKQYPKCGENKKSKTKQQSINIF